MSYDSYMSDGVYGRWWDFKTDEDIFFEKKERENEEILKSQSEIKKLEENIFILNAFNAEHFSCADLKNVFFKRISRYGMQYASKRYCYLEKLPKDYASLALKKCRISDILRINIGDFKLDVNEVNDFERRIKNISKCSECAYDRVTKIQRIIHEECIRKNGENSHLELPRESMRMVLSYSRLYLLICDAESYELNDFQMAIETNSALKSVDAVVPLYLYESNRKFIPNWSARSRNTIYFYFRARDRKFVRNLLNFDDSLSKDLLVFKLASEMCETNIV